MNISVFESLKADSNIGECSLDAYLLEVLYGRWQDMILLLRAAPESEQSRMKDLLPGVTMSGLFSRRANNSLLQHSGFINMDWDDGESVEHVESVKKILSADKNVYSCFVSPRYKGLRIVFRINGAKHKESYYGIAAYLLREYNLIVDPQSMVVSRSFHVTYDPHLYKAKHDVPMWKEYIKEPEIKRIDQATIVYATEDYKRLMAQIKERKLSLLESYQDWMRVGIAFAEKFGEAGRDDFHFLSGMSDKYEFKKTDKQYDYCLKYESSNSEKVGISTFFYLCKQAGLQVASERTMKIRKATQTGKAAGLSKQQIADNLKKFTGIEGAEALIEEVFDSYTQSTGDTVIEQLELFIMTNFSLRRNEVTKYLEHNGLPLNQSDVNGIFVDSKKVIAKVDYHLMERLLNSKFIESFNPIMDYFASLSSLPINNPVLPEVSRSCVEDMKNMESPIISMLASTISNNEPSHTEYFLRKWLVSVVSSAFGEHSPLVLVLIGGQGTGKTEFFRRLVPKNLKKFYAESKLDAGKDDYILMTQKLIIMDDEFGGKSKKEADKFKDLTSKEVFSLREPYGRNNVDLKRLAVLCGTSNIKEILVDSTGNRRIIPIFVEGIDQTLYNKINKDDLWKEMFELWKAGYDWRIVTKDDNKFLNKDEETYSIISKEEQIIERYFAPTLQSSDFELLTATDIAVEIETLSRLKLNPNMLGRILSRLGFTQDAKKVNGQSKKFWKVIKINRPHNNSTF